MLVVNHSRLPRFSAALQLTLALLAMAPDGHGGDLFVSPSGINDSAAGRGLSIGSPYRVAGDTLQTWTQVWSSTGATNTAGSVTATDNAPPPRTSRFLRLRVTR